MIVKRAQEGKSYKNFFVYSRQFLLPVLLKVLGIKKAPIKVGFQPTRQCNLKCIYCSASDNRLTDYELNTEEAKSLIRDLKKLGIALLVFTGGEPLLRNDIYELVRFCKELRLCAGLATNGILLTEKKAWQLKDLGLDWFHLSLDGPDAKTHERFRGLDSFDASLCGLRNALKTGVPTGVTTTITKYNKNSLRDILNLLAKEKVSVWFPTFIVPCGQAKKIYDTEAISMKDDFIELFDNLYNLGKEFKNKIRIYFNDPQFYYAYLYMKKRLSFLKKMAVRLRGGCAVVGGHTIYINSDGSVKPCAYFPDILPGTNVRDKSIIEIYHNDPFLGRIRNKDSLKGICRECKFRFCCGGCRSRAYLMTGDYFEEDKACPLFQC